MTEPALLIWGPQDATAFVGDRVLLKATYTGRPEPSVRWTRAVSYSGFPSLIRLKSKYRHSVIYFHRIKLFSQIDSTNDNAVRKNVKVNEKVTLIGMYHKSRLLYTLFVMLMEFFVRY